jgi:hypothetical protein
LDLRDYWDKRRGENLRCTIYGLRLVFTQRRGEIYEVRFTVYDWFSRKDGERIYDVRFTVYDWFSRKDGERIYDVRFTVYDWFSCKDGERIYDVRFTVYDWFSRKDAAEQRREALCGLSFLGGFA